MKKFLLGIAFLVMGVVLFKAGLEPLTSPEVKCGERVMHAGEQCNHISRRGGAYSNDYAKEKSASRISGIGSVVVGPLLALGGAALVYDAERRRRRAPPRVPARAPGPLPQGSPPPVGHGGDDGVVGGPPGSRPGLQQAGAGDFSHPVELGCVLDADVVMKRLVPLFAIMAVVVWLVAAVAVGLMVPEPDYVSMVAATVIAVAVCGLAYVVKRRQLQRTYRHVQRLIVHPGGLRRFDQYVLIDIPWTGITAVADRNSALRSHRAQRTGALAGAANAAIERAQTVTASGIVGEGTVAPLPGASRRMLKIQDRLYGANLARGYPHRGPDCVIFPAEFEHDWTTGVVGAWLGHYRPDLALPTGT